MVYYTPKQAKDEYIRKLEAASGVDLRDIALYSASAAGFSKAVQKFIPYLGQILFAAETLNLIKKTN